MGGRAPGQLRDLEPDLPDLRAALARELRAGREKSGISLQELAGKVYSSKASR